jgi:hypothetical protein
LEIKQKHKWITSNVSETCFSNSSWCFRSVSRRECHQQRRLTCRPYSLAPSGKVSFLTQSGNHSSVKVLNWTFIIYQLKSRFKWTTQSFILENSSYWKVLVTSWHEYLALFSKSKSQIRKLNNILYCPVHDQEK